MANFNGKVSSFKDPVQLPANQEEHDEWLKADKEWWEKHPMRYDFTTKLNKKEFTQEFYREIDTRFFSTSFEFAPYKEKPFETIIDFQFIKGKKVLEIGVGNGSHAQLLASNCAEFTGIDLTEYAVRSTSERLMLFGIKNASIIQMNAEQLDFPDNYFDYVWSWGVIHCAPNTLLCLKEINRVLKKNGKSTIMVYYRSYWYYYFYSAVLHGIFKGYFFKEKNLGKVLQRTTDGAFSRFYRIPEWKALCSQANLKALNCRVYGQKNSLIVLPTGKLKDFVLKWFPGLISRFFCNTCRMGYYLTCDLEKEV